MLKLKHACTYFVCSEILYRTASSATGEDDARSLRVMYKQQECYVQYTSNSICNVFVVLNCSPHNIIRRIKKNEEWRFLLSFTNIYWNAKWMNWQRKISFIRLAIKILFFKNSALDPRRMRQGNYQMSHSASINYLPRVILC